jgi:hypothetical protein
MRSPRTLSGFILHSKIFFFVLMSFVVVSQAQDIRVNGGFLADSLQIGEQTAFYLAAHYPSDLNLLFPDSTADINPFELQKRVYFPTRTTNGISEDSAIYYLTTFEVDRIQSLSLPVYVVQPQDCTVFDSPRDSIQITQLVADVPDSVSVDKLPLRMNAAYHNVDYQFNFWIALIACGLVVVIAVLIWIFFGKKIRVWLTSRRLRKRHLQFIQAYNESVRQLQTGFSPMTTETALSSWKKYMEQLEARPYTKLTTRETLQALKDDVLAKNLKSVDSAIYGHNTSVLESLEVLKGFADQRFSKKLEELKHG